jgi:hypothetical protein
MIEYFTKRIAPNNTQYHFVMQTSELMNTWIKVTRITKWYLPNEVILLRKMSNNLEGLTFFQTLLDSFPRDQLYKE